MKKLLLTLVIVATSLIGTNSAKAFEIQIDNFSDLTTGTVAGLTEYTFDGTKYSIARTVTGMFANGNSFSIVSGVGTATYSLSGTDVSTGNSLTVTWGDLFDAAQVAVNPNYVYPVHGIKFNYAFQQISPNPPLPVGFDWGTNKQADIIDTAFGPENVGTSLVYDSFAEVGQILTNFGDANTMEFEFTADSGGLYSFGGGNLSLTPEPSAALLFGSLAFGFVARRRR